MADLVERYVHQVGRYLPKKERAEIEAELRSVLQDQLDDRYDGTASAAEVAAVLAEFGDPRKIAASYNGNQYLVGPSLYPYMMLVLRPVWLIVPTVVVFLHLFGLVISAQAATLQNMLLEPLAAGFQATLVFSAVIVLIFALIQHFGAQFDEQKAAFNPLELPEVDDPRAVDRVEATFGVAIGTGFTLALFYFLYAGGLTLNFNLSNPGDVIPFPTTWMILLIVVVVAQVLIQLYVLRHGRWSAGLWLTETVLEVFGAVCLYFAVLEPFFAQISAGDSFLANLPLIDSGAQIIAVGFALLSLVSRGYRQVRLWTYTTSSPAPFSIQNNH